MFQMLGSGALQMGVPKHSSGKEKIRRSDAYGKTTKDIAREETSMVLMNKSTRIQQCIEHAPEKCSNRGEGIKDQVKSSNICRV